MTSSEPTGWIGLRTLGSYELNSISKGHHGKIWIYYLNLSRCEKLTYVLISGANTMAEICPDGVCRMRLWKQ